MPLKRQAAVETALSDDEISEDGVATDSTSSSSSSSTGSAAAETQMVSKEPRTGGSQDPTQHQFAMTRKTIHVVSSWNQPASGTAAMRMACGRQLLTSSLKMISYGDVADSTSTQSSWLSSDLVQFRSLILDQYRYEPCRGEKNI